MNINIQLGSVIYIDGDRYKCAEIRTVLDSDIGCGQVVEKTFAVMVSDSGFKMTIHVEAEA